jgi:hypothetical protein
LAILARSLLVAGAGLALWTRLGRADRPRPETPVVPGERQAKDFAWFGALGFPDVRGCPFVRVATGEWSQFPGKPPTNSYVHGFLLGRKGDDFTVLTVSLQTEVFHKTPPGTPAHQRVGYESLDLGEEAAALVRSGDTDPYDDQRGGWPPRRNRLDSRARLFVLAWACWRNELSGPAAGLHALADRSPRGGEPDVGVADARTLRQLVASDLANALMGAAEDCLSNLAVPRKVLVERFEHISRDFPESEHAAAARENACILRRMVCEDAAHAHRPNARTPFDRLGKKEQIALLIFRLRDQTGQQWSWPGSCDIFRDLEGKEDTPAHYLAKIGYGAVPQLIEALSDERFTRAAEDRGKWGETHYLLRVGDCAARVLSHIAALRFDSRGSTLAERNRSGETAGLQADVRAWYAELRRKGEKRLLMDNARRGDWDSYQQACRLLERYPDAALGPITAGMRAAHDRWTRKALLEVLDKIAGDGPVPCLMAEAREGPYASGRLAAAQALHRRGRPEGVAAMIAEWQVPRPGARHVGAHEPQWELGDVAAFLAGCGEVRAIEALARDLQKRPVALRLSVVSTFGEARGMFCLGCRAGLHIGEAHRGAAPPAVRAAAERLLLDALDDTEACSGMSGQWDGKAFKDPRVCDFAAHVLNQIDPARYGFDLGASRARRDRALRALRQAGRTAEGKPPREPRQYGCAAALGGGLCNRRASVWPGTVDPVACAPGLCPLVWSPDMRDAEEGRFPCRRSG